MNGVDLAYGVFFKKTCCIFPELRYWHWYQSSGIVLAPQSFFLIMPSPAYILNMKMQAPSHYFLTLIQNNWLQWMNHTIADRQKNPDTISVKLCRSQF